MRRVFAAILLFPLALFAQAPVQPDAAQIRLKLMKLNFLGSVLYVAAHPDDENTRIITYMANERLAATGYLSMTRGDGGQNLIGPEIRDELGLIRTYELLAARKIDGGEQFFTRAVDFGYSKSADETVGIWGKNEILSDVVKVYRMFKPDVVLTRFPPDERAGHGHHTASAILAGEAFDLAGRKDIFPDQVSAFGVATPVRLYTNTGRWWNTSITEETPGIIAVDVGTYSMLLGKSYTEIAAISRSQHKSQGFGSEGVRGEQLEFFEYVKGEQGDHDLFEGINTTWSRVKGGDNVKPLVEKAIQDYKMENPAASVPALMQIRKAIGQVESSIWKERKLKEVNQLIQDCLGLYCEATADNYYVVPGERVTVNFEIVNRSAEKVIIESVRSVNLHFDSLLTTSLADNAALTAKSSLTLEESLDFSDPYWLREAHSSGIFNVSNKSLIGYPDNPHAVSVTFAFTVGGEPLVIERPLVYRWTDPVKGEQYRPLEVIPAVELSISNGVWIFSDGKPKNMTVTIRSHSQSPQQGQVKLTIPQGWKYTPSEISFELNSPGDEVMKNFQVVPPAGESVGVAQTVATTASRSYSRSLKIISYDHLPIQTLLPDASARIVRLNINKAGNSIGYIEGAGDDVPAALRTIGYEVWEMKNEEVTLSNLSRLDAVVLGIRALSTRPGIEHLMKVLLAYAEAGGTLVLQYNNNFRLEHSMFAPYPLTLSRDRVSEEDAEVKFLAPEHPVLNTPNKISHEDFDGWVQERGLYFPDEWDPAYAAILSMHDKGEDPMNGGLLVARYGKGYYVYTGLSFFRELPEGVPGAYKLFANIVSLGKDYKGGTASSKNKPR
jgi:LmbE family N-acetylglucosaminyl deacetylase